MGNDLNSPANSVFTWATISLSAGTVCKTRFIHGSFLHNLEKRKLYVHSLQHRMFHFLDNYSSTHSNVSFRVLQCPKI
jgi:hypothetical protein